MSAFRGSANTTMFRCRRNTLLGPAPSTSWRTLMIPIADGSSARTGAGPSSRATATSAMTPKNRPID
jgi:hypothetical protein